MPLKLTISKLDDVAEPMRAFYRQRGDGADYILDVEGGAVAKSVHDEFRQKNIELQKKLTALGDLTPEGIAEMTEKVSKLESDLAAARKGKDADAEARIKAIQDGLQQKIDQATKQASEFKARLENVLVDGEVAKIAMKVGAHDTALDDITGRLRSRLKVGENNEVYAVDPQGNKIYGEDGKQLGIDGAVRQLTKQAPHLFKSSSGGGAAQSSAGGGRSTAAGNPWSKDSWNVTEQMKAMKADSAEASRLAAEAGHKL